MARSLFGALRDRAILLPDDEALTSELSKVRLVETGPGLVRLDHRSGEHDDQAIACALLCASLLDRPGGTGHIFVAEGDMPRTQLTMSRDHAEPPPAVVKEGEERPIEKLYSFDAARRNRGYRPPGSWR